MQIVSDVQLFARMIYFMVSSLTVLLWMFSALCPMDADWYFSGLIGRSVKLANVETEWSVLTLPLYVLVQWCLGTGAFFSYFNLSLLTLTNVRTV